tara:strand:+ start:1490 stop:2374 length:885 start_codon:yes stop_codon:yes gene_type:complete
MPKLEDLKKTKIQEMIRAYNDKFQIKGWSKLKKAELISKLRNHPKLTITENSSGVKIKVKKDDDRKLVRVGGRLIPQRKKKAQAEQTQAEQTEKKSNIPKITITEAEEKKDKRKPEPKSSLGPIPKSKTKIRVGPKKKQAQAEKTKKEPKNFVKFDTRHLDIEHNKDDIELVYHLEDANIYIEIMVLKVNKEVYLEFQMSQYRDEQPRAPKGWTRSLVCQIVDYMIKEKMTNKNKKISLVAGDIASDSFDHDMKKLKQMYKSMGFQEKGPDYFEMKISKFQEWCKTKYSDLYFN